MWPIAPRGSLVQSEILTHSAILCSLQHYGISGDRFNGILTTLVQIIQKRLKGILVSDGDDPKMYKYVLYLLQTRNLLSASNPRLLFFSQKAEIIYKKNKQIKKTVQSSKTRTSCSRWSPGTTSIKLSCVWESWIYAASLNCSNLTSKHCWGKKKKKSTMFWRTNEAEAEPLRTSRAKGNLDMFLLKLISVTLRDWDALSPSCAPRRNPVKYW